MMFEYAFQVKHLNTWQSLQFTSAESDVRLRGVLSTLKTALTENDAAIRAKKILADAQSGIHTRLSHILSVPLSNNDTNDVSCPLYSGLAYHNWIAEGYAGFGANMMNLANAVDFALATGQRMAFSSESVGMGAPGNAVLETPVGCQTSQVLSPWVGHLFPYLPMRRVPSVSRHGHWMTEEMRAKLRSEAYFPHPASETPWLVGTITQFLVRPREEVLALARQRIKSWFRDEPWAAVHLRRSEDKKSDLLPQPLDKYFFEVESWFAEEEIRLGRPLRRLVFVSTDGDERLIDHVKREYPRLELFYDVDSMRAGGHNRLLSYSMSYSLIFRQVNYPFRLTE